MRLCDYGCCPREVRDWFCGAGGAAEGLHRAWPHSHIVGYDIKHQSRYPFDFVQCDWTEAPLDGDFYWASPVCKKFSSISRVHGVQEQHPDYIAAVRDRLIGTSFVIENVAGAPLLMPWLLCGSMLGLGAYCHDGRYRQLRRHRYFETPHFIWHGPCQHAGEPIGVYGDGGGEFKTVWNGGVNRGYMGSLAERCEAMGIDWMTRYELSQAVPPAYSEYIARQLNLGASEVLT